MPLHEIRNQMQGLAPGSAEEAALLMQARGINRANNSQIGEVKAAELEKNASAERVVDPATARHAGNIAVEQVTGEFQVPVHTPPHETA
jgi:hypothetical protein